MFGSSFSSLLGSQHHQHQQQDPNLDLPDQSEVLYISAQALLKMLKHARYGIPMEVMGLMLGKFEDNFCAEVTDVFAMPQSGSGVAVEDIDPVFQSEMLQMLEQVGRSELVVGWYHSHPGLGCWLSSVDQNTQLSFQQLQEKALALVLDPVQSVKGKVVIDAFRLTSMNNKLNMFRNQHDPRQITSNTGLSRKPSAQALIHGLDRMYYSVLVDFKIDSYEKQLLSAYKTHSFTSQNHLASGSGSEAGCGSDFLEMLGAEDFDDDFNIDQSNNSHTSNDKNRADNKSEKNVNDDNSNNSNNKGSISALNKKHNYIQNARLANHRDSNKTIDNLKKLSTKIRQEKHLSSEERLLKKYGQNDYERRLNGLTQKSINRSMRFDRTMIAMLYAKKLLTCYPIAN